MNDAVFRVYRRAAAREVSLGSYLDPQTEERATTDALRWIKSLRHATVDGQSFRHRFTFRGDSLWWFAELYLHKQQVIAHLFRSLAALESLISQEEPTRLEFVRGSHVVRGVASQIAAAKGVGYDGPTRFGRSPAISIATIDARAAALHAAALASRFRDREIPTRPHPPEVAAFVHRAFWRATSDDGSAEAYIGPVLSALEERAGKEAIAYVSVGPSSNFTARRWWHPLRGESPAPAAPAIESYAPLATLRASRNVWRDRHATRRALWKSEDLRARAMIGSCDCWPIVREELAGVALLQWPWSARAMDEAAAALDALRPRSMVTYAEAGGWGRALVLEARRRQIPSIGLQHGFIYRHWLNYLHEPDEMIGDPAAPTDGGFPYPTSTLLFDDYAARHLVERGHYPATAVEVTGSPRLDALVEASKAVTPEAVAQARATTHAGSNPLVLVATKYREARRVLRSLVDGAAMVHGAHLVIKTHPAETPDVYAPLAADVAHVTVLDASSPLGPLLSAARAVVTVNSTVAIDAAVLGIPTLVIGLPNNLTPFVEAGLMAGAERDNAANDAAAIAGMLRQILYDEEFRRELARTRQAFLTRFRIGADGRAAARAADAVLRLAARAR
jgi:hypothetical protein